MRILSPKVHVEVFRPLTLREKTDSGRESTVIFDPGVSPNELRYRRVVDIDDRRIKGVQFEETALFGGFIEVVLAEDPQSQMFDRFVPNDHVEVFYDDINPPNESLFTSVHTSDDYDFVKKLPKFQGATWKADLEYSPTVVNTKINAWDYLRLLQYINIPRGEQKGLLGVHVETIEDTPRRLKAKETKIKYGDDMLDYIDAALDSLVTSVDKTSIFGEQVLSTESQYANSSVQNLKFGTASSSKQGNNNRVKLYTAGIGEYCHNRIRNHIIYKKFLEVKVKEQTWSEKQFHTITEVDEISNAVEKAIENMEDFDILQFRFLDGKFRRFKGIIEDINGVSVDGYEDDSQHYVADIIIITQFALVDLLVKKLTIDHGLNQWFTPIIRLDPDFLTEIKQAGQGAGKAISKLVYIRLRNVKSNTRENTYLAFNTDTYQFASKMSDDLFKLVVGNLYRTYLNKQSKIKPDVFAEVFSSIDFPQPEPPVVDTSSNLDGTFRLWDLLNRHVANTASISSNRDMLFNLFNRFKENFRPENVPDENERATFYRHMMKNITSYGAFMQKILNNDDKLISFIKSVPASYMRADIYTGSKFNTLQYDSLAITRIIQLLTSAMAGFPVTNSPVTNTEKGKIDSYPIFTANRIVIKPRAFFGRRINKDNTAFREFEMYESLSKLFSKVGTQSGSRDQRDAACFLFIDVAKRKLKGTDEEPNFILPMEDIQDFGMIKAATVNHFFNFSITDHFSDMSDGVISPNERNLNFSPDSEGEKKIFKLLYANAGTNGIRLEYREGGVETAGFSPPEHNHLTLADLTQNPKYNSWSDRATTNTNMESIGTKKAVFDPRQLWLTQNDEVGTTVNAGKYYINNYDTFTPVEVEFENVETRNNVLTGDLVFTSDGSSVGNSDIATLPWHGITKYVDITDLQEEYATLNLIFNSEYTYRDISNVDLELMENVDVREPLRFEVDLNQQFYNNKINLKRPGTGSSIPKLYERRSVKKLVKEIDEQLSKIDPDDMPWLFPVSGFYINSPNEILEESIGDQSNKTKFLTHRKHLFLVTYLDLLVKGIRYLLWSLAKARFFCHVYVPIEYEKYTSGTTDPFNPVIEPGVSVKIKYSEKNTLFKSVDAPLVAFPISGLDKSGEGYLPLYQSISRQSEIDEKGNIVETKTEKREFTWYVSKKVTYLGADSGAMMRLEMTEGSLDWTLFYNEKNLLTQVSEHYLLNGLGNFRSGIGGSIF